MRRIRRLSHVVVCIIPLVLLVAGAAGSDKRRDDYSFVEQSVKRDSLAHGLLERPESTLKAINTAVESLTSQLSSMVLPSGLQQKIYNNEHKLNETKADAKKSIARRVKAAELERLIHNEVAKASGRVTDDLRLKKSAFITKLMNKFDELRSEVNKARMKISAAPEKHPPPSSSKDYLHALVHKPLDMFPTPAYDRIVDKLTTPLFDRISRVKVPTTATDNIPSTAGAAAAGIGTVHYPITEKHLEKQAEKLQNVLNSLRASQSSPRLVADAPVIPRFTEHQLPNAPTLEGNVLSSAPTVAVSAPPPPPPPPMSQSTKRERWPKPPVFADADFMETPVNDDDDSTAAASAPNDNDEVEEMLRQQHEDELANADDEHAALYTWRNHLNEIQAPPRFQDAVAVASKPKRLVDITLTHRQQQRRRRRAKRRRRRRRHRRRSRRRRKRRKCFRACKSKADADARNKCRNECRQKYGGRQVTYLYRKGCGRGNRLCRGRSHRRHRRKIIPRSKGDRMKSVPIPSTPVGLPGATRAPSAKPTKKPKAAAAKATPKPTAAPVDLPIPPPKHVYQRTRRRRRRRRHRRPGRRVVQQPFDRIAYEKRVQKQREQMKMIKDLERRIDEMNKAIHAHARKVAQANMQSIQAQLAANLAEMDKSQEQWRLKLIGRCKRKCDRRLTVRFKAGHVKSSVDRRRVKESKPKIQQCHKRCADKHKPPLSTAAMKKAKSNTKAVEAQKKKAKAKLKAKRKKAKAAARACVKKCPKRAKTARPLNSCVTRCKAKHQVKVKPTKKPVPSDHHKKAAAQLAAQVLDSLPPRPTLPPMPKAPAAIPAKALHKVQDESIGILQKHADAYHTAASKARAAVHNHENKRWGKHLRRYCRTHPKSVETVCITYRILREGKRNRRNATRILTSAVGKVQTSLHHSIQSIERQLKHRMHLPEQLPKKNSVASAMGLAKYPQHYIKYFRDLRKQMDSNVLEAKKARKNALKNAALKCPYGCKVDPAANAAAIAKVQAKLDGVKPTPKPKPTSKPKAKAKPTVDITLSLARPPSPAPSPPPSSFVEVNVVGCTKKCPCKSRRRRRRRRRRRGRGGHGCRCPCKRNSVVAKLVDKLTPVKPPRRRRRRRRKRRKPKATSAPKPKPLPAPKASTRCPKGCLPLGPGERPPPILMYALKSRKLAVRMEKAITKLKDRGLLLKAEVKKHVDNLMHLTQKHKKSSLDFTGK